MTENKDAHLQKVEIDPNMQYILAGDISASMSELDPHCAGQSKYHYMLEKFECFIREAADFDPDGVTVLLFGEFVHTYRNTTLDAIKSKLNNVKFEGWTNTDLVIKEAWELHKKEKIDLKLQGKAHPGTVLFIFTDGAPTNRKAVENIITEIANSIDRHDEFNIGFLTVGTVPNALADWLDGLDNDLKAAKHDIVNVSELESVSFLKAVEKAIND